MTNDDKTLVERLRSGRWLGETTCGPAADRIEALSAENERLEKAIKVQASAVRTLQANEQTEINLLRKQKTEWHRAVTSLDSEREANAILTAENERLREALTQIEAGTYPRPLGKSWRMDLSSSKHDRCIHDEWMYEVCEVCLDDFVRAALGEQQ